jgi:hypothetical protein
MPLFIRSPNFLFDCLNGVHDFARHEFKICLTNQAPSLATTGKQQVAEVPSTTSYPAGGMACRLSVQRAGNGGAKIAGSNVVFSGSQPPVGPFQFGVLYNASSPNGAVLGWWQYDEMLTLNETDDFLNDPDPEHGIYFFE